MGNYSGLDLWFPEGFNRDSLEQYLGRHYVKGTDIHVAGFSVHIQTRHFMTGFGKRWELSLCCETTQSWRPMLHFTLMTAADYFCGNGCDTLVAADYNKIVFFYADQGKIFLNQEYAAILPWEFVMFNHLTPEIAMLKWVNGEGSAVQ